MALVEAEHVDDLPLLSMSLDQHVIELGEHEANNWPADQDCDDPCSLRGRLHELKGEAS
jgi:hypothetical protein